MEENNNQSGEGEMLTGVGGNNGRVGIVQDVDNSVNTGVNANYPMDEGGSAMDNGEAQQPMPTEMVREDYVSSGPYKSPKKSHKGLLLIFAIVGILVGVGVLFYVLLSEQIIKNDFFPKKEPDPVVVEPEPEPEPRPKPVATDKSIDYGFLKMEAERKNLIYSPLSIKYALSLLGEGASGETKAQIEAILGDEILTTYENVPDKLSLANAVFIKNDFQEKVLPDYINTATEKYDAEILFSDFKDASEVDRWIDEKTFGLIKDSGLEVNPATVMALVNALAIQLDWEEQFKSENTRGKSFYKNDNVSDVEMDDEVTMMQKSFSSNNAKFYDTTEIKAVSMDLEPVSGAELEFVAIMPEGDLDTYIDEVNDDKINVILNGLMTVDEYNEYNRKDDDMQTIAPIELLDYLVVEIPKFKFDYELEEFGDELKAMGMSDAFDRDNANLSGIADRSKMSGDENLFVSQAIHKANIDFSEDGIKAAAITVIGLEISTAIDEPTRTPVIKEITFDKPFMFLIRDKNTGEKWFIGTVYEPNLWADDEEEYREKW